MEGSSASTGSRWFDITKTKLAVMSSLLGVGTIIYFTKNYLEKGRFVPWASQTSKQSSAQQPKIIGGKRSVVIKQDTNAYGGVTRKVMHRQRSRQGSTCSSRSRRSNSMLKQPKANRGSLILENIDINLNNAISELSSSVNEVQDILGLSDLNGSFANEKDIISPSGHYVIEGEVEKLRRLIDFAQDVSAVTDKTSEYVLKQQQVLEDIIPLPEMECENYEALADDMFDLDDDYDSDDESFISATESLDLELSDEEEYETAVLFSKKLKDLIGKHNKNDFYMQGIEFLTQYGVPVRTLRTELLNCDNDVDFCVKVHCLRTAFTNILKNEEHKKWFVDSGREMLVTLLKEADHDYIQFTSEFDKMVNYCSDPENWSDIDIELSGRGVCKLNFYDIVLDLLIMDSFQDLDAPPSAVTSAIQNRWLSTRIKYTALSTAIWAYIKTKKRTLENQEGFFSIFYDMSMYLTPLLAWGFLGPVKELNQLCTNFKDSMVSFLRDIFSVESANYKSVQALAEDVIILAKKRKQELMSLISR